MGILATTTHLLGESPSSQRQVQLALLWGKELHPDEVCMCKMGGGCHSTQVTSENVQMFL